MDVDVIKYTDENEAKGDRCWRRKISRVYILFITKTKLTTGISLATQNKLTTRVTITKGIQLVEVFS